jgi:CTP:molybdopterin cytidylyltransferase MocA
MIVGLLLAAGGARRFGSQKLLAPFRGQPLVRHAAAALASAVDQTIAVVGRDGDDVGRSLAGVVDEIVENPDWSTGLASSVRRGIGALPSTAEAVVVALGDQPAIDPAIARAVVARWRETGQAIVAPQFRDGRGHPVLFARAVFEELRQVEGDVGAKRVIERAPERVAIIAVDADMPADVDTPGDLDRLG